MHVDYITRTTRSVIVTYTWSFPLERMRRALAREDGRIVGRKFRILKEPILLQTLRPNLVVSETIFQLRLVLVAWTAASVRRDPSVDVAVPRRSEAVVVSGATGESAAAAAVRRRIGRGGASGPANNPPRRLHLVLFAVVLTASRRPGARPRRLSTSTQNDRAPPKKMRGPDCRRTGHDVRPSRLFENETALFVGRFHGRLLLSRVCGQFRPRLTWNLCINLQSRSVSVHQLRNVLSADLHVDNATVTRVCIYKYSYTRPSVSGHCKSGCIFRRTLTFDLLL